MRARNIFFGFLILLFTISNSATAATKVIKVSLVTPQLVTTLSGGAGDQISDISVSSSQITSVGTYEGGTSLGGSDGFITTYDKALNKLWELRLGTGNDDIAGAIVKDQAGFFWIAGASSTPQTPIPALPIDPLRVNIEDPIITPTFTPKNALTRLMLWKVSPIGELVATFTYDAPGVIQPTAITFDGLKFKILGSIDNARFSLEASQSGELSNFLKVSAKKIDPITVITAGSGKIKSFISTGAIKGIPLWKPKSATPVLIEYTKAGLIKRASYFQGKITIIKYDASLGPIVVNEQTTGFGISILGIAK